MFRTPGFIPLIGAQFVSSLGDWIGLLAILAIAKDVSGRSGTGIGLVMIARMLPGFVLAPIGGVLLDRWNRKVVMVTCDIGRFALLMILPFWHDLFGLVVLSFLIEILTLLWGPAKDASVPNIVKDPDQLASANTLGLIAAYGTFLIGAVFFALLAGISKWLGGLPHLVLFHDEPNLLPIWVDGLTFLVSAFLISRLRLEESERGPIKRVRASQTWHDIVDGLRFVRSNPLVRGVMIGLAGGLIGGGMIIPLGPLFAEDVLGGGNSSFGILMIAFGVGAAVGVVTLLMVQRRLPREAVFTAAIVTTGSAIIGTGAVSSLTPALFLVVVVGAGAGCGYVTGFTVLQERVSDEMRGRTFSTLYTLVRFCLLLSLTIGPFIAAALNSLSNAITDGSVKIGTIHLSLPGARLALWFGGVVTILSGFAARRRMRMAERADAPAP
ncbi:MAG TPA: MFS transporter [Acidimicrobiia bacterium]|nr:MFS transporter [Acidimicrobiia bacterium]